MANRIKLKRSSVSGNAPTTGDIEVGEVALNMADQVIHYRDGSDNIKQIVHGPANTLAASDLDITISADGDLVTGTDSGFGGAFNTTTLDVDSEGRWPIYFARHYYGGANNSFSGFANAALQFETFAGTRASPLAVESGKRLMAIGGSGSIDTSGDAPATANIVLLGETTEAQSATNRGAKLTIATIPDGATARSNSAIFQGNDATFFQVFVKTSNSGTDGLVIADSGGTPEISTLGTDQDIIINPNGDGILDLGCIIQLDTQGSDPGTGANGQMYYNTTTHKFRGYANGSWVDLN